MSKTAFLILPGATATADRLEALRVNASECWPEARVEVLDYLSRFRDVKGVGSWIDDWVESSLTPDEPVSVFAFILGAAALPFAPELMARTSRLVVLRSRYQEAVPRYLRRRFGAPLTALLFGRAVSDLGRPPFWPHGYEPACPTLTVVETRPTKLAERLRVPALTDQDLGVREAREVMVDHDFAYYAPSLMKIAVQWLRAKG